MKPIVAVPSLLAADLQRLGEKVRAVDQAGAAHGRQVRAEHIIRPCHRERRLSIDREAAQYQGAEPTLRVAGGSTRG